MIKEQLEFSLASINLSIKINKIKREQIMLIETDGSVYRLLYWEEKK